MNQTTATTYIIFPLEDFINSHREDHIMKGMGPSPIPCTSFLVNGIKPLPNTITLTDVEYAQLVDQPIPRTDEPK